MNPLPTTFTVDKPHETFQKVVALMEKVKDRLYRAKNALEAGGIPYAIIGGNAVASWVATRDESQVRTTADVDILLHKSDLERARAAMQSAGFHYRRAAGVEFFQDGKGAKFGDSVHLVFAETKVRPDYVEAAPAVSESTTAYYDFRVLTLEALVRMKLTSYRLKDRVHLQDMLNVGLLDESWMQKVPPELRTRMREVLDTPEG